MSMVTVPEGPVYGPLRIAHLTAKGSVAHHEYPARVWPSARSALDVGHRMAAMRDVRSYSVELEIVRLVTSPDAS
jgi:hypothetical protein